MKPPSCQAHMLGLQGQKIMYLTQGLQIHPIFLQISPKFGGISGVQFSKKSALFIENSALFIRYLVKNRIQHWLVFSLCRICKP
jgi:hypothetical protein